MTADAARVIQYYDSYTEVSPSGHGVHIIAKGKIPSGGHKRGGYEIYDRGRYFTITGVPVEGTSMTVNERSNEAALFHAEFIATPFTAFEGIQEGSRNSTLSSFAGKVLTRYGDCTQTRTMFDEKAGECVPPLCDNELETIYKSAQEFYHQKVEPQLDYIPPDEYNTQLRPADNTDVGESLVLSSEYGDRLKHSTATEFIVYDGTVWNESEARARGCLHELTQRQLDEFEPFLDAALDRLIKADKAVSSAKADGSTADKDKAAELFSEAEVAYKIAKNYHNFILKCRDSVTISGVMREAKTPLEIDVAVLDANALSLNTPGGEVDLATGAILPHKPDSYHTKITTIEPSVEGEEIWHDFLSVITCGDRALEDYLQMVAGQAAVGRVYNENLVIAYGIGRNGKSTFFNTISRLMGDYAGQISAEILTTGRKNGKCYELAELRGKRLIIAPELEEGTRLDAAFVKKICSTDKITGEKKYKDPFDFEPSHVTILYTNHLPRVGSDDAGTWRRLIVVPFNASIEGDNDIKNYADHLVKNAGGAVLAWVIEGARKYIAAGFQIDLPACVKQAIESYRADNDWLNNFLSECCEVSPKLRVKASELLEEYRRYCTTNNDYVRSSIDFKTAMEKRGFKWKKLTAGGHYFGLGPIGYVAPLNDDFLR
ncbi:hypothetical protein FACS1894184_18620 [Clostridia bacterium]|nr:hypothetical protein FACS1894184_18620 [Clostridia bacterium]